MTDSTARSIRGGMKSRSTMAARIRNLHHRRSISTDGSANRVRLGTSLALAPSRRRLFGGAAPRRQWLSGNKGSSRPEGLRLQRSNGDRHHPKRRRDGSGELARKENRKRPSLGNVDLGFAKGSIEAGLADRRPNRGASALLRPSRRRGPLAAGFEPAFPKRCEVSEVFTTSDVRQPAAPVDEGSRPEATGVSGGTMGLRWP